MSFETDVQDTVATGVSGTNKDTINPNTMKLVDPALGDDSVLKEEVSNDEGSDDEEEEASTPTAANLKRRKSPLRYIENKTRRHVTFAKRRHGIMKKAYELSVMTGTNVLLLIMSPKGLVYSFATPKLRPVIENEEGKALIRKCLNSEP
ncbi:Arginine metabolism regulation protein I [Nakaseomyces bracarensis]|uniref:Arginine metabolism regulation protein I n=1 Tax=Nakaseomyces bracarensis TaxID=273131 RepID=A0ABR4NVR8_9SACH